MKKVSVILIDWKVRESFHSVDYLNRQAVPRSEYEVIWVEYYDHRPSGLQERWEKGLVDKWIVLGKTGFYFKHLLFNEGVLASEGDIIAVCDSDALFSPTFIESVIKTFDGHREENIILYLDEVRNNNRCFYPFKDVSWDKAMATPGLINWNETAGKPYGLTTSHDIIHHRNYGACFCARREDVIKVGGFDEHPSYHCFFCGPYELGWRLVNKGFKELWHDKEWLLHVWHPWVREGIDILGESDGRGLNATAMEIRKTGRVTPLLENRKIRAIRTGNGESGVVVSEFSEKIINHQEARRKERILTETIRKSFLFARYLFMPARASKVLVLSELDPENSLYKSLCFTGIAGRVEKYNYDQVYHSSGYDVMCGELVEKCRKFRPDLVVFVPLKKDIYLSPEEKVAPGDDVFELIKSETGAKVFNFSVQKYGCLVVDPLGFFDRGLDRDIDVVFWGSVQAGGKRERFIKYLRENGIKVCTRDCRLPTDKYAAILSRSKIGLSFSREGKDNSYINSRALEIMYSNCLLIEEECMGTGKWFRQGEDFVSFSGQEELLDRIRYYLKDPEERKRIASSGYQKAQKIYNVRNIWLDILPGLGFERNRGIVSKLLSLTSMAAKKLLKRIFRPLVFRLLPTKYVLLVKALARRLHLDLA